MSKIIKNQDGIAAFLIIVIISSVALIMAYSASILGLGELEIGFDSQKGGDAFAIADGCIEEGMRRIRLDTGYTGDTLNIGDKSCIIGVSGTGSSRIIIATSTVGDYHKKIQADITFTNTSSTGVVINLDGWEEVE